MCIMFSILSWRISVEIDCRRDRSRQCQDIRRLSPFVNFIHSSGNCCVRCLLRTLLILICAYKCVKSCCHIRFRDNGSYICVKIQQRGRYRASPVANFARAFGCLKSASLITVMGLINKVDYTVWRMTSSAGVDDLSRNDRIQHVNRS